MLSTFKITGIRFIKQSLSSNQVPAHYNYHFYFRINYSKRMLCFQDTRTIPITRIHKMNRDINDKK